MQISITTGMKGKSTCNVVLSIKGSRSSYAG
jgi:hypothetical protein